MTSNAVVELEVVPFVEVGGVVHVVSNPAGGEDGRWTAALTAPDHPNETSLATVLHLFSDLTDPGRTFVHGVSWRYRPGVTALVTLTYVAVLTAGRPELLAAVASGRLRLRAAGHLVAAHGPVREDSITQDDVIGHALEHLAWLYPRDAQAQLVVPQSWKPLLAEIDASARRLGQLASPVEVAASDVADDQGSIVQLRPLPLLYYPPPGDEADDGVAQGGSCASN